MWIPCDPHHDSHAGVCETNKSQGTDKLEELDSNQILQNVELTKLTFGLQNLPVMTFAQAGIIKEQISVRQKLFGTDHRRGVSSPD